MQKAVTPKCSPQVLAGEGLAYKGKKNEPGVPVELTTAQGDDFGCLPIFAVISFSFLIL